MRRRLSLRSRATLIGTLLFTVVLVIGSALLLATLESRLTTSSDQLSRARVADLLDLARTSGLPAELRNIDDNGMAQVVGADGEVLAASPNLAGRGAVADGQGGPEPTVRTFDAPDDQETETYRVWYATGPSPDGDVTAYVGSSLESVAEASAALRRALWIGVPVVALALGVVIWLLLGRALGRLDRIRAEVDRISAENLHARVAGDGVDDEVGRLAATMNAMLGRLDTAAQQQRDFVADVSHDLQSPLAAQRIAVELALARPDAVDTARLRADVLGPTADMERMVRDLLVLASLDADTGARPAPMDLDALALEEATRARVGSEVRILVDQVSAAPAYADPDDVRRIVRNLLENAVTHAATQVVLVVEVDGADARLDVLDDGPGIHGEQRELVFERFHQVDAARSRGTGSGLGLPIARGLADRNGGRLELLTGPGGAHFRLRLPTVPA
jgi:signal transduction histidine kinase